MPDVLDQVKDLEMMDRTGSLDKALHDRPKEPAQRILGGQIVCIDCEEVIEPERLVFKPEAARCAFCQQIEEQKHGR